MKLIDKLAWIAKIELTEEEKHKLEKEIQEILKAFEKISEVDTSDVEFDVISRSKEEFREEKEPEKFDSEEIIKNFPKREAKRLSVPRFL
jgi:aspartyl-tRNA(Asn)/glutamyl-tRNA(Gln) amidotransferase subunit C